MPRWLDFVISTVGLLFLSPLFLLLGLLVRIDSPGPVFYRAQRIGLAGKPFQLYKFRSMISNADKSGPAITAAGDQRITRIGRLLRRTKLDELPQLINVVKGEMALVGPRPEAPEYVARYSIAERDILDVRPGITSAASLAFRHEEEMLTQADWHEIYINQIMPTKLKIDLEYQARRTVISDVKLLLKTVLAVFK